MEKLKLKDPTEDILLKKIFLDSNQSPNCIFKKM